MLKHFGSGSNIDAVLGDLAEQYQQHGNAMWYWRQAMKAIPVSFFRDIRGHKWVAARSVLIGWVLWTLYVTSIFPMITPYFFGGSFGVDIQPSHPFGSAWTVFSAPVGIQAGLNQPFSFVFGVALPLVAWAMCAWMVSVAANLRVYRVRNGNPDERKFSIRYRHGKQTSVVLLFAGSTLLFSLLSSGVFVHGMQQQVYGSSADWLNSFVGHLAASLAASIMGILLGGGLLREPSGTVSQ
jgi:hypothetical protein